MSFEFIVVFQAAKIQIISMGVEKIFILRKINLRLCFVICGGMSNFAAKFSRWS